MIITVVNRSKTITDEQLLNVIRAINRQVKEDFEPYWSLGATLRLEGAVGAQPDKLKLPEMRGDAILYLTDKADVADALGYHEANFRGIPYGFVFIELCKKLEENWTVTLSHEALELIGDAQGNLLVQGPHPSIAGKEVFHWFEMCDAVQSQTYKIDEVEVSNFVLPLYFTTEEQEGGRNDFLGRLVKGKGLRSFGVNPGGYIGYYDPQSRTHETYFAPADKKAATRAKIKNDKKVGRGFVRKRSDATAMREDEHKRILDPNALASSATCPDPIRHVVVLMLENRSFDHMLGDATSIYPDLEGIPQQGQKYRNTSSASGTHYDQKPIAARVVAEDPPHEFTDVQKQIGNSTTRLMGGFVDTYLTVAGVSESTPGQVDQVMAYFPFSDTPTGVKLPALQSLASNFLICDHWFSSVPGPTWPNRFFVHSGTCLGRTEMPAGGNLKPLWPPYNQTTIYDRLSEKSIKWRIYHDGVPQSIVMTNLLPHYLNPLTANYSGMTKFFNDAAGDEADFPQYAFIEPNYGFFGETGNDQHPPSDVVRGDQLIASVYNAIRGNEALWNSTLLIITHDEHGGFFDHVPPPATVAPDDNNSKDFQRLGVRVPAILVSPWVDKGVCKTQFDHTSLLRYACDKWGMPQLSKRASPEAGAFQSNSLLPELIKRAKPREDAPSAIASIEIRGRAAAVEAPPQPVAGAYEAMVCFLASLPEGTLEPGKRAARKEDQKAALASLEKLGDKKLYALAEKRLAGLTSIKQGQTQAGHATQLTKPTTVKITRNIVAGKVAKEAAEEAVKKATEKTAKKQEKK